MNSETLVIFSVLSKDLYPENNGGSFTNELAPPLLFESNGHDKINDLASPGLGIMCVKILMKLQFK